MCKVVPIPEAIAESPTFRRCDDILLLYDSFGGLPVPLPHNAVVEVLALVEDFRTDDGSLVPFVEQWQAAVLGFHLQRKLSPMTTPVDFKHNPAERAEAIPGDESPFSAADTGAPAPTQTETEAAMVPVVYAPETEPHSENHEIFSRSPQKEASPLMPPVVWVPEVDPQRESPEHSRNGTPAPVDVEAELQAVDAKVAAIPVA